MCGIVGVIGDYNEQQLNAMLTSQHHRGPDATRKYLDPNVAALGHNRLAIIDLSEQANQPFLDPAGRYVLVFNGEIYNYIELKETLKREFTFKTSSDTEVLLAAYIKWGPECLSKLNGMFAFAIWDNQEKKLFAARDRFGVKPFYYHCHQKAMYFASEIKAMHAAEIPKIPNEKVWASYFAYGSYGNPNETFWENIEQLPGGHYLEYINQKLTLNKWYFFEEEVAKQPKSLNYKEAKEQYLALLKDSIRLRFRADVPVGFNISGGLDSSVLLALVNLQENGKDNFNIIEGVPPSGVRGPINAYTFYTNDPVYDELSWVEAMIAKTRNPLTKVLLQPEDVPDLAQKMVWQQDEPYGGIPTLAYAKIFEQARKDNVLVLLDGQGMDEQWAGYDYYTKQNEATIQGITDSPFKTNVLSDTFLKKAVKPNYPKPFEEELLNKQYRDLFFTKIPRALRFNDRISMAYSTELREPFLDYRLVEFAFSLPLEFKIKEGITKFMLREIAAELITDNLAFTPKRALQTPQREWLGNELKEFVNVHLEKMIANDSQKWFDKRVLRQEWENYLKGDNDSSFYIWQCVSLGLLMNEKELNVNQQIRFREIF